VGKELGLQGFSNMFIRATRTSAWGNGGHGEIYPEICGF
jgi:hypothetical protein